MGFSLHYGISPMPTSGKVKKVLLDLLPPLEGNLYELGSGWGHLLFPLARLFPHAIIHAYEGSPIPWIYSKLVQKILHLPNVCIHRKNFYSISLSESSCVFCYLYPGAMSKLKKKFENELKLGTIVVSHTFAIPGWIPEKVVSVNDLWRTKIYLYRKNE